VDVVVLVVVVVGGQVEVEVDSHGVTGAQKDCCPKTPSQLKHASR